MRKGTTRWTAAFFAMAAAMTLANMQPVPWTKVSGNSTHSAPNNHWDLFAVQTSGAPALGARPISTNTVMLYWPAPSAGYNLQVTTNMGQSPWVMASEPVQDDGTNKWIQINPAPGYWFYRLTK